MPGTYKVLGQSAPLVTALTDVYMVPGATQAVVSSVLVCNRGPLATTYRLAVAIGGAADSPEQYLAYDAVIDANDSHDFTIGATLNAADVIRGYVNDATVSFNIFGEEITP